jgi:hypothetical protein
LKRARGKVPISSRTPREKSAILSIFIERSSVTLRSINYLEEFSTFSKNFESRAPKQKNEL